MSTFPNEIVTCGWADGTTRRLFCKYAAGRSHPSFGHRGGLAYEARVYRDVLGRLERAKPEFLGAHTGGNGEAWLVLEFLDRCTRLKDIRVRLKGVSQPVAMALASRWLGRFHATQEGRVHTRDLAFLTRYTADYFEGWARRTCEFATPLRRRFPWLERLGTSKQEWFRLLLSAPPTVIHGEFYINNILVRRKRVFPVDWESAAIGAGEIDLAALIEGPWARNVIQRCVREYARARWPRGALAGFEERLDAARLYLYFRWLGERPDWTLGEKSLWRFRELRRAAKRLGLL